MMFSLRIVNHGEVIGEGSIPSLVITRKIIGGTHMAKPRMESRRAVKRELAVLAKDFELLKAPGVKELIETATDYHKAHNRLMTIYNQEYLS